jgi:hypothetical protein
MVLKVSGGPWCLLLHGSDKRSKRNPPNKFRRDSCALHRESRAMGRPRKQVVTVVALSVDALAEALTIPRSRIARAIAAGELVAYCEGPGKPVRVIVSDAIEWIKRTWLRA